MAAPKSAVAQLSHQIIITVHTLPINFILLCGIPQQILKAQRHPRKRRDSMLFFHRWFFSPKEKVGGSMRQLGRACLGTKFIFLAVAAITIINIASFYFIEFQVIDISEQQALCQCFLLCFLANKWIRQIKSFSIRLFTWCMSYTLNKTYIILCTIS